MPETGRIRSICKNTYSSQVAGKSVCAGIAGAGLRYVVKQPDDTNRNIYLKRKNN